MATVKIAGLPLSAYRKTFTALVGAILTWTGVAYIPDGHVDRMEWFGLAIALATALGVYGVTNEPPGPVEELAAEEETPKV